MKTLVPIRVLTLLLIGSACHEESSDSPAQLPEITNLGLRANQVRFEGDTLLAQVAEEPGGDLNGDGDDLDSVVAILDLANGSRVVLPYAAPFGFSYDEGVLAFVVSESSQGSDLNGDGLLSGEVLVIHELATGVTTNLGLAVKGAPRPFLTQEGPLLAFTVSEDEQHQDLDGDGLATHDLVYTYEADLARLTPLFLGSALRPILNEGRVFVSAAEAGTVDRNGDGDTNDQVLLWRDVRSGFTENLARAVQTWSGELPRVSVDGALLVMGIAESAQGQDLDQDGDSSDVVLEFLDLENSTSRLSSLPAYDLFVAEGLAGTFVPESDFDGTDLNADGDSTDVVAFFYDRLMGLLTNTATAVETLGLLPFPPVLGGGHAAFLASESAQGELDQNGDGDADDYVLQLHDGHMGTTNSKGLAGWRDIQVFDIDAERIAFATLGGPPLLGSNEPVPPFVLIQELATGAEQRIELPVERLDLEGERVLLCVFELNRGESGPGTDRNGDGDDQDKVAFVHDLRTGLTHGTGLAVAEFAHMRLDGDRLAVLVPEGRQGSDLNGDGDEHDFVLHVVKLP